MVSRNANGSLSAIISDFLLTSPSIVRSAAPKANIVSFKTTDTSSNASAEPDPRFKHLYVNPAPVPHRNAEPDKLQIAAYNVYLRPFYIAHDGQRERLCQIPQALIQNWPELDVVVFEEAFSGGTEFRKLLALNGFPFSTKTIGAGKGGDLMQTLNGGVFVASRWPIEWESQIVFKAFNTRTADRLSKKGCVYARVNKNGQIYHIFGTHLQANCGIKNEIIRERQAAEINEFQRYEVPRSGDPGLPRVLTAGDLNCDLISEKDHALRIMDRMGAIMPPMLSGSSPATYVSSHNSLIKNYEYDEWLDYILVSTMPGHAAPSWSCIQCQPLLADRPFYYCSSAKLQPWNVAPNLKPIKGSCVTTATTRDYSDHYPVICNLSYVNDS